MLPRALLVPALILAPLVAPAAETPLPPHVFLAGDSTMADKPLDLPERGWGMALQQFFKAPAMVLNHAMNGRSTKSFIAEGRWDRLVMELRAGDFVIIQFGHNDEKIDKPGVGTDVTTEFPENLRRFVREVRAKNATPLLATPVARRKFDPTGRLTATHGAYPEAVRAVAKAETVPLLELERATSEWLQGVGDEPSKKFFMWIQPGQLARLPGGSRDDTHFVDAGAQHVAELAVAELKRTSTPLAQWLK